MAEPILGNDVSTTTGWDERHSRVATLEEPRDPTRCDDAPAWISPLSSNAAAVLRAVDGSRTPQEIADDLDISRDQVELALWDLGKLGLLERDRLNRYSRRR